MNSYKERIDSYCKRSNDRLLNLIIVVLSILTILVIVFFSFFQNVLVIKTSMRPTISDGQTVTIFKTKDVNRGDIIVFKDKLVYHEILIKRVIGVENDIISIGEDGILHITFQDENNHTNYKAIREDYILEGENIIIDEFTVPAGCLYVLGDNRLISHDSSEFGAINKSSIIGKVIRIK